LQESAAMPGTSGGLIARAEPDTGTGPASPGGSPPRRRRSLAAILIVGFAVICLIGLGAFATVLLLHGRTHARPPALPSVFQLRVGDCVNSGQDGISSPTVVACGQPHDAEIYARFALAGHGWPGSAAIGAQARRGCTARLGSYLNPQLATTVLAESYVFPDQGAWNAGERTVICEIRSTTGKLTGSIRGLS
jgi:putative regulator of septum formation